MPKPCKKNEILRKGYTRKAYSRNNGIKVRGSIINPGCINKRSKTYITSRSTRIILNDDDHFLSNYGYFDVEHKSKKERLLSLEKVILHFTPIKGTHKTYNYIIKALNARYILNKNTNPKIAQIFKADQKTISLLYKKLKLL